MLAQARFATWVEVDLAAIEDNVRYFLEHSRAEVMAVVKADAYGHGAVEAARAALRAGATWCAVARVGEGLALRKAGIACPILILGYAPPAAYEDAIAQHLSLTVWRASQVAEAVEAGRRAGEAPRLHLKVDSGMRRLGVEPQAALDLVEAVQREHGLRFEGLFTHFARADEADPSPTEAQMARFGPLLQTLEQAGLRPRVVHAANSAAGLTRPDAHFDLIRAGIAIYGLQPSASCPLPDAFRPALTWKARLAQVKRVPAGEGVSYGHAYVTHTEERIGTLPVGYADGLRRAPGNVVLVGGRQVPVVGRVCMDQCMLQLDGVPDAQAGDEVVLIGEQGGARISAEEVAGRWGTINYEVTCGIRERVARLYP